jgi:hypothetical protein
MSWLGIGTSQMKNPDRLLAGENTLNGQGPPKPETKAASLDGFIEVTPFLVGWVSVL